MKGGVVFEKDCTTHQLFSHQQRVLLPDKKPLFSEQTKKTGTYNLLGTHFTLKPAYKMLLVSSVNIPYAYSP
jgi:hypothetical protein